MAFRRKDIKKAFYYVWFLGAKESKGLRGEQYIFPVLHQLLSLEKQNEPCKVTIQISSKGIKIIQNVPKKSNLTNLPSSQNFPPLTSLISPENKNNLSTQNQQNTTIKMEQIKHFIPHHAVTCALQNDDIVCIILLLYNPLTGCPVHVHGYRCDSVKTAFTLRNQLQILIERPENQRKFAEIEARLAAKGLISQAQLLLNDNSNNKLLLQNMQHQQQHSQNNPQQKHSQQQQQSKFNNNKSSTDSTSSSTDNSCKSNRAQKEISFKFKNINNMNKHNSTLTSDGRTAEDDSEENTSYSSPTISLSRNNRLNDKSKESFKNNVNNNLPALDNQTVPNPVVVELYENLAAELKAKLGNPKTGPILLPPRDYDTVCRSQGKLIESEQRACTNALVVGAAKTGSLIKKEKDLLKQTNVILDTSSNKKVTELKLNKNLPSVNLPKSAGKQELSQEVKQIIKQQQMPTTNIDIKQQVSKSLETNKLHAANNNNINNKITLKQLEQAKLKQIELQKQQAFLDQQKLLFQQQQLVRRELSQQHKPSKFVENMMNVSSKKLIQPNSILNETKKMPTNLNVNSNCKKPEEQNIVIQTSSGLKQIGSSLANKIKQTLIGSSNKDKLQPQLICHKSIHDSLQSLNKIQNIDKHQIINKNLINKIKENKNDKKCVSSGRSSSNSSNDLNKICKNSRSNASSGSKSASSGIGSSGLNLNQQNLDDTIQYLSTDEELEDEVLIHDLNIEDSLTSNYIYNGEYEEDEDELLDNFENELDREQNFSIVKRKNVNHKLGLNEKNKKNKLKNILLDKEELNSSTYNTSNSVQITSSEEDVNSICYDENLMLKIKTTKRIKNKQIVKKLEQIVQDKSNESLDKIQIKCNPKEFKTSNVQSNKIASANYIRRSETCYDGQTTNLINKKKSFINNFKLNSNYETKTFLNSQQLASNQNQHQFNEYLQKQNQQMKLYYFPNSTSNQNMHSSMKNQLSSTSNLYLQNITSPNDNLSHSSCSPRLNQLRRQQSTPSLHTKTKLTQNLPILRNTNEKFNLYSGMSNMEKIIYDQDKFYSKSNKFNSNNDLLMNKTNNRQSLGNIQMSSLNPTLNSSLNPSLNSSLNPSLNSSLNPNLNSILTSPHVLRDFNLIKKKTEHSSQLEINNLKRVPAYY